MIIDMNTSIKLKFNVRIPQALTILQIKVESEIFSSHNGSRRYCHIQYRHVSCTTPCLK
jgi:hypothetical protein